MTIRNWPENERPREKLLRRGAQALSDAELLAIFIHHGTRGRSAMAVARSLLENHGSLRGILGASREKLCAEPGVGPCRYAELQAALELGKRHLAEKVIREGPLTSPAQVSDYLQSWLRDRPSEVFACLFLDTRHHVLAVEELFQGTVNGTSVHPREVVRHALARNAAAVIAVHNHPSGVADPSRADEMMTRRLRDALALVDISLLDHIVVGDGHQISMSEMGVL